jgi:hypothetical protein
LTTLIYFAIIDVTIKTLLFMNTQVTRNVIKNVLSFFAVATLAVPTISGLAQTNPGSPAVGINFTQGTTPSASTTYGLQITACRYTFDWTTYLADQKAGRENSNPYIDQGCVATDNTVPATGYDNLTYASFPVGQDSTKQAFKNDPVVGIYSNKGFAAQSLNTYKFDGTVNKNKAIAERDEPAALPSIFTEAQLKEIYTTGGARTAAPRIFSTGPDEFRTLSNGTKVYRGGRCEVKAGNIVVRTKRAGEAYNPTLDGINPADPFKSCARQVNNERKANVEDQMYKVYQFVYEFTFPTAEQCQTNFGVDANTCLTFFRNRYGRDLAGNATTGTRTLSTYTYYGTFNDTYSKFVGWTNPDINGPRAQSEDGFVRAYDGYSVYSL